MVLLVNCDILYRRKSKLYYKKDLIIIFIKWWNICLKFKRINKSNGLGGDIKKKLEGQYRIKKKTDVKTDRIKKTNMKMKKTGIE